MEADGIIHLGILAAALLHHALAAAHGLLRRLEEELDRAGKLLLHLLAETAQAEKDGGVNIVAAGVHDAVVERAVVPALVLLERKRVDVAPDAHHIAGLFAPDDGQNAGVGAGLVLDAPGVQVGADAFLRLLLVSAQLGVPVQIPADGDHFIGDLVDACLQIHIFRSFGKK